MNIIILHGFPAYSLDNYFLNKHFKEKGQNVIAPVMFVRNYTFSTENVLKDIEKILGERRVDVVIGISLGGLVAPYIASEYQKSKLILISTGVSLKTESFFFNLAVDLVKYKIGGWITPLVIKLPENMLLSLYRLGNPFKGVESKRSEYESDAKTNIRFIKSVGFDKIKEVVDFVKSTDNTNLLKTLKNKTIIFTGSNDVLMTKNNAMQLSKLIVNSKVYLSKGSHFNSFTPKDLPIIDSFIS